MTPIFRLLAAATGLVAAAALAQPAPGSDTALPTDPAERAPATTAPVKPPPPATPTATPPPIVVERKVDLRTPPGGPEDLQAARQEAIAALHWARTEGCRDAAVPRECLRRAEEDYRAAVGRAPKR